MNWFTTAPAIPPSFWTYSDGIVFSGRNSTFMNPAYRTVLTVWCHMAYSAFCLQWFAIGWAMLVGAE